MIISAIAAVAKNRIIGIDNDIPWFLPLDLKWFKKQTSGHHIIMGRSTFESFGKPLPNRTHVVITRDMFYAASGCVVVHSIEEAIEFARENGEEEAFIIGGGQIYKQTMPLWDKFYWTEVEAEPNGDVHFPEWDLADWTETFCEHHDPDERHKYGFTFHILERKNKA
ncbi:MAG: dihydrofolate reductase [Saprospiraceae bacterium]|nr:dihydrofolate reductase [Saprospiraceae bacterium]